MPVYWLLSFEACYLSISQREHNRKLRSSVLFVREVQCMLCSFLAIDYNHISKLFVNIKYFCSYCGDYSVFVAMPINAACLAAANRLRNSWSNWSSCIWIEETILHLVCNETYQLSGHETNYFESEHRSLRIFSREQPTEKGKETMQSANKIILGITHMNSI